jgi:outer membrane protein OmpA-like peptidoglycan-associated protein
VEAQATQQFAILPTAPVLPAAPSRDEARDDGADDLVEPTKPLRVEVPREPQEASRSLPHAFVSFPFGSASLTDGSKLALNKALPSARAAARIVISGRTDSVGDQKANEALALSRALAVREYLRDQLPDLPNIISIDAKGRCCFIASNDTADGRAKNRRVEVAFVGKGGA